MATYSAKALAASSARFAARCGANDGPDTRFRPSRSPALNAAIAEMEASARRLNAALRASDLAANLEPVPFECLLRDATARVEAGAAAQRFIRTLGPAEREASVDQPLMAARIRRGRDVADELYGEGRS